MTGAEGGQGHSCGNWRRCSQFAVRPLVSSSVDHTAIRAARRSVVQQHYVPQPPDFPVSRAEPAYLKTVWLRIR